MADAEVDECGVCAGDNSSCADCAGVPNGTAVLDDCGVCGGNGLSCGCDVEEGNGSLDLASVSGSPGSTIIVPFRINEAPNDVRALGVDLLYNIDVLEYVDFETSSDLSEFDNINVNMIGDTLIVGGYEAGSDYIEFGESADVVNLEFVVGECEVGTKYQIGILNNTVDDVTDWTATGGCLICGGCDVNSNMRVTPEDALCAFEKYLGICPSRCGSCDSIYTDINNDGRTTPQDALEIFKSYLGIESICPDVMW